MIIRIVLTGAKIAVAVFAIFSAVIGYSACVLSGRISREEEADRIKHERPHGR